MSDMNADKRRAVMTLLRDEEWGKWSAREIARRCVVSHDFASRLKNERDERSLSSGDSEPVARTYTTKHGTQATMRTENIGRCLAEMEAKRDDYLDTKSKKSRGRPDARGGEEHVTPAERSILESASRLSVPERFLLRRLLETGDPELASRLATVVGAKARLLGMVGLETRREERDLNDYLRERQQEAAETAQDGPNGARPAEPPQEAEIVAESAPSAAEDA